MPYPIDWGFALPYYLAACLGGYLLGSFPSGLVLTRLAGLGDIRDIGSGNIGATNVLRTGKLWLGVGTLLSDVGKAALAVWLGGLFGTQTAILAAGAVFLGHLFPIWLGFRGGKGIAVYIGALLILSYPLALLFGAVWVVLALLFRYSSLSALVASTVMPFAAIYLEEFQIRDLCFFFLILILWAHRENIRRLWLGQESKLGQKND